MKTIFCAFILLFAFQQTASSQFLRLALEKMRMEKEDPEKAKKYFHDLNEDLKEKINNASPRFGGEFENSKKSEEARTQNEKLNAINKTLAKYLLTQGRKKIYKIVGTSKTGRIEDLTHDEGKIVIQNNVNVDDELIHITISQTKLVPYKELKLDIDKIENDRVIMSGSTYSDEDVSAALVKNGEILILIYTLNGNPYIIYFGENPISGNSDFDLLG